MEEDAPVMDAVAEPDKYVWGGRHPAIKIN
jgi:hypothetical protein